MRLRKHPSRRRAGMATLDVVICTAVAVPIAAAAYALSRVMLDTYYYLLGSAVGSPLF